MTSEPQNRDLLPLEVEIWKQVVDVQKHFNDLCLRVRSVGISLLGVLLAAAAALHAKHEVIHLAGRRVSVAFWLLLVALIVWVAMYVMDRLWYHVLLRASVEHGIAIEDRLNRLLPSIGLSTHVQKKNHAGWPGTGAKKLQYFYGIVALILLLTMFLLFCTAQSGPVLKAPGK